MVDPSVINRGIKKGGPGTPVKPEAITQGTQYADICKK